MQERLPLAEPETSLAGRLQRAAVCNDVHQMGSRARLALNQQKWLTRLAVALLTYKNPQQLLSFGTHSASLVSRVVQLRCQTVTYDALLQPTAL